MRWKKGLPGGRDAGLLDRILIAFLLIPVLLAAPLPAKSREGGTPSTPSIRQGWSVAWGGHVKAAGSASRHDPNTIYRIDADNPFWDGRLDGRLKNRLDYRNLLFLDTHYEMAATGGDTRKQETRLRNQVQGLNRFDLIRNRPADDRRLFNLTKTIRDEDDYTVYHRLDRLRLVIQPNWGAISVGRQALTWGNGLLFHPMDLFNPFAPSNSRFRIFRAVL